jgi:lysophospholipase L1-like esterase
VDARGGDGWGGANQGGSAAGSGGSGEGGQLWSEGGSGGVEFSLGGRTQQAGGSSDSGTGGTVALGGASTTGGTSSLGGTGQGGTGQGGTDQGGAASGGTGQGGTGQGGTGQGGTGQGGTGQGGTDQGGAASGGTGQGGDAEQWLPSWATSIQRTEESNLPPPLAATTLRQFIWPTFSGSQIRLQLSNEKGSSPVVIERVHVARAGAAAGAIEPSSDTQLLFSGTPQVTIPPNATVWSDPADFELEELTKTAISIHFTSVPTEITGHPGSRSTSYIASGNLVSEATLPGAQTRDRWYFIDTLEVMAPADAFAIATLGDSITDGYGILNEFARWPDFLTLALKNDATLSGRVAVLNFGMGANSLLSGNGFQDSGLVRFERDVLGRSKIRWLIVLHGVNDIGNQSDLALVDRITAAYQQIAERGREAGILVYGSPLLPFKNHSYAGGQALTIRSQINDWVRTSGAFDQVLDLAAAVADPSDPERLLAAFSNDGLHPSRAGYEAMGNAVELSLFRGTLVDLR